MEPVLVSIVIRSFNRPGELAELVRRCLTQDYPAIEIVVVEQSTTSPLPDVADRLAEALDNPRVHVLHRPPLGPAAARNEGVRAASGEILVFIDDDDLPVGRAWLAAHVACYDDPDCLGVVGRQVQLVGEPFPYLCSPETARRRCLTFSPLLKVPRCYHRQPLPKRDIEIVNGTNSSLRRAAIERFGLWDETTVEGEENSFCFRLQRAKRPDEYLRYLPEAVILRRLHVPGGLDRRRAGPYRQLWLHFEFAHRVIGHYFPLRFVALYPVYLAAIVWAAALFLAIDNRRPAAGLRVIAFSPAYLLRCWFELLFRRPGARFTVAGASGPADAPRAAREARPA